MSKEKHIGRYTIKVETDGLDELNKNAEKLVQNLEKAKTITNELADVDLKAEQSKLTREDYQEVLDDVVTRGQQLVHKMTTQVVVEGSDESIEIVECSGESDAAKLEAIIHFGEFVMKVNQDNLPKSGVSRSIGFK